MKTTLNILWKDILIEWRTRSRMMALLSFAYTILLLFAFAIGPDSAALRQHAGAYLWLGLLLSSTLLLDRSMRTEFEAGAISKLLLAPVSAPGLFYGKAIANTIQLWIIGAVSVPMVFVVCDATLVESSGWLALTLILGSAGLAAPGTLYSAMVARLSGKQLLLPLMLFPLVVPVIVSAVKATSLVMLGDPMNQIGSWLALLACFNLVYWGLCGVLFGRVVEA
jgi:heme exporter protein B